MITTLAVGRTKVEARQITPADLIAALGGLPPQHSHCAALAVGALRQALDNAGAPTRL